MAIRFRTTSRRFIGGLRAETRNVEKKIAATLKFATGEVEETITRRTPVWSGAAVRNMIWTMGSPNKSAFAAMPDGRGQRGTNLMPLGPELYRGINTQASKSTLAALRFARPFTSYHLSNAAPHIGKLEHGDAPTSSTSRQPAGLFLVTFETMVAKLATRN